MHRPAARMSPWPTGFFSWVWYRWLMIPPGARPSRRYPGCWATPDGQVFWAEAGTFRPLPQRIRKTKTRYTQSRYLVVYIRTRPSGGTMVHHVVLDAFRGPRPNGQVSRHLNGDSLDNRIENLDYGSQKENWNDAAAIGAITRGEGRANHKISEQDARYIKGQLAAGCHGAWLAEKFKLSGASITNIKKGRLWPHVETPVVPLEGPPRYRHRKTVG